jgi:hypothetical protein
MNITPELAMQIATAAILESEERDAVAETERLDQVMAARDARRRHADAARALAALIREAEHTR